LAELGKKTVEFFDGKIDKDELRKVAIEFGFVEEVVEDEDENEDTSEEETQTNSMFGNNNGVENV